MFCGHFKVTYFTHESFKVSESRIAEILKNEIAYVENMDIPEEKSKSLLNSIDQFIVNNQHPELAIIRCKYPYKLDIKISLFGRKSLVRKTKKKLQSIINKHTMKTVQLKLTPEEHEYAIENCIDELQDIENEYKDDNVKIRIRLKEFSAPQYLIETIKEKLKGLMVQKTIFQYQKIGNSIELTDNHSDELKRIARQNYCRIEGIETKTGMKLYSIPKALSQSSNVSSSIVQNSNEFISSLSARKISIMNGSIEIYLTNQSNTIPRDVTIISSPAAATEEHIDYLSDNGYFEMKAGKKFLFHRWAPIMSNDDKASKRLKRSIEKFISSTLQSITTCFQNVQKILYLTNEWENVGTQYQEQLATNLINEVKQELETRKNNWQILLIFNDQQINLHKEFQKVLVQLQTDKDGFAQVAIPISILPNIDLTNNSQIQLTGLTADIGKTVEKYKLMSINWKEKSSLNIPPPVAPRTLNRHGNRPNPVELKAYNIYFSYCQYDQAICNRINTYLYGEGYLICETLSNMSKFQSYVDKSDVILVAFSEKYSENEQSLTELNYAKSARKKMIPFVIRNNATEHAYLTSLTLAESFYDLFDIEMDIEFKDDFELEYERLLNELLRHTKPGTTGKIYAVPKVLPKIAPIDVDYEEGVFGHQSIALQNVTAEQRSKRERTYQEQMLKKLEMERIPDEDVAQLFGELASVTEYLEEILRKGVNYSKPSHDNENEMYSEEQRQWPLEENLLNSMKDFLNCIRRWLNKAPNVIKGNIKPFTPTGDINDAIFTINKSPNNPTFAENYIAFDHSPPEKYFSLFSSNPGLCLNNDQTHEYYQMSIYSGKLTKDLEKRMNSNKTADISDEASHHETKIENELRTSEEMQKLNELDNPNRIWKNSRCKKFIEQKIKNILELNELCEKFK
ncbi:unnamed protein product [Rotaria sp. Silwood1]|nr:unnamed protein product [Rotaria sp. Silwood1]CAF1635248.1 unnamed protein product [Rotaria sp. Silwood1]CAF3812592.1 unnamed protein product [Rotaria sp. Silwood1]CAF3838110.1 unnamed protein product [Rotaria sp. Silwood1]CAF4895897.1 unnamed protein product [Rotaria sp. Silwood1]